MGRLDGEEYPAYDAMVSKLLEHKFLPEKEVLQLCERARSLLSEESNVQIQRVAKVPLLLLKNESASDVTSVPLFATMMPLNSITSM